MVSSHALGVALLASIVPAFGAVHESLAQVPSGWTKVNVASDDTKVTLSAALVRQNMDKLESKLMSLSTPGGGDYGKWMDSKDIESAFPTVDDSGVVSWLKKHGINTIRREGSQLHFATDVGTANKLLDTNFAWYQQDSTQKLRTTSYSLPDELQGSIELISPTTYFGKAKPIPVEPAPAQKPSVQAVKSSNMVNPSCRSGITPDCLRELYQVGDFTPKRNSGARIGYGNFLNQSSSYADLAQFEQIFGLPAESFDVTLINGGVNDQSPDAEAVEANLDVQIIVGLTHPMPIDSYITGGLGPLIPDLVEPNVSSNEPYLEYYEYLLSQPNSKLPQVISNSYGEPEQTIPPKYAERVCNMIGMMGLRGISVLESSGDTGVGAGCQSNDGKRKPEFEPQFPGTCPYITSVGGTQFVNPEVAWNASSGGFSNYWKRPSYQNDAVQNYLDHQILHETKEYYKSYTNFEGRGFPDISAHSLYPGVDVVYRGKLRQIGGTSAACPQVASIIALLNSVRMTAGKPSLGFLNPLLYSMATDSLHDITEGAALGCQGTNLQTGEPVPGVIPIPYASWNATPGWDPVTGLGTPNFKKLKDLVMSFD